MSMIEILKLNIKCWFAILLLVGCVQSPPEIEPKIPLVNQTSRINMTPLSNELNQEIIANSPEITWNNQTMKVNNTYFSALGYPCKKIISRINAEQIRVICYAEKKWQWLPN